jgi:hypothetical protein
VLGVRAVLVDACVAELRKDVVLLRDEHAHAVGLAALRDAVRVAVSRPDVHHLVGVGELDELARRVGKLHELVGLLKDERLCGDVVAGDEQRRVGGGGRLVGVEVEEAAARQDLVLLGHAVRSAP